VAFRARRTTLLRLVRATPATPATPEPSRAGVAPPALGVAEWAFRRGPPERRFGTILVDLLRHRPVDLLREATAGAVASWLRAHPGARVIRRDRGGDRGGAFAEGAKQGAPHAKQVADQFHLLRNLGHAVKRVLQRHADRLQRVPAPAAPSPPPPGDQGRPTSAATNAARPERVDRRASRERPRQAMRERYAAVPQLAATGLSTSAIARALGLHRHTVPK
jgi:transposase